MNRKEGMPGYGPIQILVVGFPGNELSGKIAPVLRSLQDQKMIRVLGFQLVSKDEVGNLTMVKESDLSDEETEELGMAAGALAGYGAAGEKGAEIGAQMGRERAAEHEFGLTGENLRDLVNAIPNKSTVIAVLIEHLWAKELKGAVRTSGGMVLGQGFLTPEALMTLGEILGTKEKMMA